MKPAVLVLLAACRAGDGDGIPVGGGDAGTGDAGAGDAGAGDAGIELHGRVCLLTDLRRVGDATACAGTGASNLRVSLGTRIATTTDDGSFTMIAPLGGGLAWHVTGTQLVTSVMPFGADATIPAISDVVYGELLSTNQVTLVDQQGSIVVRVVSGVAPAAGVTATSMPASNRLALYDGNSATVWTETGGTGPRGIAWFADVPLAATGPTFATIALMPRGRSPVPPGPVENLAITFVTYDIQ